MPTNKMAVINYNDHFQNPMREVHKTAGLLSTDPVKDKS